MPTESSAAEAPAGDPGTLSGNALPVAGKDVSAARQGAAMVSRAISLHPILSALLPYAALLLFTAVLLWPLCTGRSLFWGDILLYFNVMLRYVQTDLRHGHLPLWNPYLLCGQPYVGNPQSALFYPTTWLLPYVPVWLFLSLNSLLHVFLCGAFAYRFLLRWTLRRASALAGAFVYMGSACLLGRLQFPPMIQTAPYFPLILACLDGCIDAPGLKPAMWLALAIGLTLFAAHAQVAYLIFVCAAIYALMRLWATHRQARSNAQLGATARPALMWLCLASGLGLLLASAHLLPALQLMKESPREDMTVWQANRFVLEPAQLLTLIAPNFLGHPATADYWGEGNAWEPALFVGWLPLFFIGYAVARCGREGLVRYWAIVALVGIWLALGNLGGLYWLAFAVVPGLSRFHDPARFLFISTFAFAALTAVGLDALRLRRGGPVSSLIALAGIAAPLAWYAPQWNPTVAPQALNHQPAIVPTLRRETGSQTPQVARLYLPAHELFWKRYITAGYSDYGPDDARFLAGMMDTLMPNLNLRYGLESASGYEPVPVAATAELDGLARIALRRGEPNLTGLLDLLNVNTLVLPDSLRAFDSGLQPLFAVHSAPLRLWHNRNALPCAWLVRRTRRIEGKLRISAALADPDFRPQEMAILSGGEVPATVWERRLQQQESRSQTRSDLEWGTFAPEVQPPAPVQIEAPQEDEIRMRADCNGGPAFLVYAGTAYPGWKARVDGQDVPLYRTDGALLGVYLSPGEHSIRLIYAPAVFRVGVYLTLLAGSVVMAALGFLWMQRRLPRLRTEV